VRVPRKPVDMGIRALERDVDILIAVKSLFRVWHSTFNCVMREEV
jgi:hypothetical protein